MIAPCVLAAGASTRLGEPKALARIGDVPAVERLVRAIRSTLDGAPVLVVTGAHHDEISRWAAHFGEGVELVCNEHWSLGRTGSIQTAVRARPSSDLLVAPVDVPLVEPATIAALCSRWDAEGAPARGWLAPMESGSGRYGHPIVVGRDLASSALALGPDAPLTGLRDAAETLLGAPVDDPSVLDDLDTPDDLARMRARFTRRD